jgi:LCP family protein required for cell wall assembly
VGDQGPRRGDDRSAAGRARRSVDRPGASPLTVEQLLARQGVDTGRRRAARRADLGAHRPGAPGSPDLTASPRPADVRNGMPPVPGAAPPAAALPAQSPPERRAGLPPVPAGAVPAAASGIPLTAPSVRPSAPVPSLPPHPSLPLTGLPYAPVGPTRKSAPVPPLPGTAPARPGSTKRARPPKPERSPARRRLVRAVVALVSIVGVLVLYTLGLYFYVDRGIDRVDALSTDGPEVIAPELQSGADTYLVVGAGVPGQDGARSVTSMLATVSQDGERAVLLSLPPTAMVDTPQCRTAEGGLREPRTEALAGALLRGGPSCMVRVVQQVTGVQVDHYLSLDLARLPGMIDALGDVPVCVPGTLAASSADRPLPLGDSTLTSDEVAGWLRPADEATDLTGALTSQRTQLLLTSTLRAALTAGTLADPVSLTRFLSRASDALTVDSQTTLGDLRELASSLGNLSGSAVQRAELPATERDYVPAGSKTPYVLLDAAATGSLFETVIRDTRVPSDVLAVQAEQEAAAAAALKAETATAAPDDAAAAAAPAAPDTRQGPIVAPSDVTLDVLNATATAGLAGEVGDQLEAEGFSVANVGNESAPVDRTVVRHGEDAAEQAKTVAAAVPGAELVPSEGIAADAVQLVVGPDFEDVVPVEPAPAAATASSAADDQKAAAPTVAPTPVSCG